eukprot:TRINITY_DN2694_c0_g1_i1.p1 TRINITY_DN2694_c0_g1~~TRINITY_DN2694_c0_g1_i1.p1  ORF type:complete len:74 (+),score=12.23 TRINITY_DN2694_c0_g1_i1:202-423(+)
MSYKYADLQTLNYTQLNSCVWPKNTTAVPCKSWDELKAGTCPNIPWYNKTAELKCGPVVEHLKGILFPHRSKQ